MQFNCSKSSSLSQSRPRSVSFSMRPKSFRNPIKRWNWYFLAFIIFHYSSRVATLNSASNTNHEWNNDSDQPAHEDMPTGTNGHSPRISSTLIPTLINFRDDQEDQEAWTEQDETRGRIATTIETENGPQPLPFSHLNREHAGKNFNPEFLSKSFSFIRPTIESLNSKGRPEPRPEQKSPSPDLVREALDYGYTQFARALMAKSRDDSDLEFGGNTRKQDVRPKGDEPEIMEYAARFLQKKLGTLPLEIPEESILEALNKSLSACETGTLITCSPSRYRTFDGTCNNLKNPNLGASDTCQLRLLPANYEDGVSQMRSTSVTGVALPSALFVAQSAMCVGEPDNIIFNMWSISIGQILAHDLVRSPRGPAQCCPLLDRSECLAFFNDLAIILPPNAPCIYSPRRKACPQCTIGPRNMLNSATSFIDLNPLYGSDDETAQLLRSGQGGLMRFDLDKEGGIILPKSKTGNAICADQFSPCVDAGDPRAVQNPSILLAQASMLRFHNQIAWILEKLYPSWSDETLFQETRRVVILHWQRIVYEEFLPLLLGPRYYKFYQLDESITRYSPSIDPSGIVEVNAAAYRIGHTMLKSFYKLEEGLAGQKALRMKKNFANPNPLYNAKVDPLSAGLLGQPASMPGVCYATDAFKFLFATSFEGYSEFAFNLAAWDIDQGRDQGLQPYPAYVEYCFGSRIESWKDLKSVMSSKNIARLKSVYKSVWDVDLMTGGLHEYRLLNGMVGPTFGCLIGIQFYNLKYGDRFFYTHYDWDQWYPAGLNIGQFSASPLHNLICVANDPEAVLQRPLEIPSHSNQYQPCDYFQYQYVRQPDLMSDPPVKGNNGTQKESKQTKLK